MERSKRGGADTLVRLRMIYNNIGGASGFQEAWGLAIWIEHDGVNLLFDTGGDASILHENMVQARLNPATLTAVIISHDHWDHRNGLSMVLENSSYGPHIFVPEEVREKYEADFPQAGITGIQKPVEITSGVWSTGSMATTYKGEPLFEQSLVIVREEKLILLTGCSHPGIVRIVSEVTQLFPDKEISLVAGGFHLKEQTASETAAVSEGLMQKGVSRIAPSHCTGGEALSLLSQQWGSRMIPFNLGDELIFP